MEGVKATETIEYNNTVNNKELKQNWMREKKEVWKNKIMYGEVVGEMPETTDEKEIWNWLKKADLKWKPCCVPPQNRKFEKTM